MPTTIRPGDVLADRYLLIDLLSETGDGRFWRAHDRVLARHVSVHVMPSGTPRADILLEAARGCARLTDRRFLRVLDAEVKAGVCYVVTEWGTGTTLQLMLQHAPLAPRRAAWLVGEVAGAMSAAHAVGVTHGRLVPENIIVDLSGTVRIVGAQVDAALKGLPRSDERGDVHELVSLLYAGLTGRWPGRSPSEMPAAPLENGAVLRPRQVRAGIPRVLDELCDDVLNAETPPRAPYDLTTARGIADYLREYVGDPASMAAAEAERGSTATGGLPALPASLLEPLPPVLPHDARPAAASSTTAASTSAAAATASSNGSGPRGTLPRPAEPV
ncbi:MAG TPA: protein kinase family protein, partial [Nocardioides sp.]